MIQAVIKTGGKQYVVAEGKKLRVEKLDAKEGAKVVFDEVLMVDSGKDITLGAPLVAKATVEAKAIRTAKADKVTGVKFKAKKRYMKYFGHRQAFTEVEITKIKAA